MGRNLTWRPYWTVLLSWYSYWTQLSGNAWWKNCSCDWISDECRRNILYARWSSSSLSTIRSTLLGQNLPWSMDWSTWADRLASTITGFDIDRLLFMRCDKRPCLYNKTPKSSTTQRCYYYRDGKITNGVMPKSLSISTWETATLQRLRGCTHWAIVVKIFLLHRLNIDVLWYV